MSLAPFAGVRKVQCRFRQARMIVRALKYPHQPVAVHLHAGDLEREYHTVRRCAPF
jgi:hypothetical protein